MRTLDEIRTEIDNTLGLDAIRSDISDQIRIGRAQLTRNIADNLTTQLQASTALTPLEVHTAAMTLIMVELYDGHTNIHALIPHEIVDAVDQALI